MMIKFLARGTGSAAADYLTREQNLSPEQEQDRGPSAPGGRCA